MKNIIQNYAIIRNNYYKVSMLSTVQSTAD